MTTRDLERGLRRMARDAAQGARSLIARGIVRLVGDGTGLQTTQVDVLTGETRDNVEMIWPFGLTANPPNGSLAIILSVGGDRGDPVALPAANRKLRKVGLGVGETSLYDAIGQFVHLKADGTIVIKANTKIVLDAPRVETTHELIDRTEDGNGLTVAGMRGVYDGHTHAESVGTVTAAPDEQMGGHD